MIEPNYPNARDCEHGSYRPKCELCQLQQELAEAVFAANLLTLEKQQLAIRLDEAREYIRARPPVQYLYKQGSEHDATCNCEECKLWRKAAGITDEPASGAWAHQIVPSMKLCPTCRAWHGGDSCYACTPSSGVDAEGLTQKHKSK
jgi:hypothetical protein